MSNMEILFLAFALSVDACVVSFTYGLIFNQDRLKISIILAIFTSFFQGLMPCLGYLLSLLIKSYIEPFTNIIVCVIFSILGIKFIIEAFSKEKENINCLSLLCLLLVGLATSIDAFSAGISLLLSNNIIFPIILIIIITFINSILGFTLGGILKKFPKVYLGIIAGVILIFLGIKSLF